MEEFNIKREGSALLSIIENLGETEWQKCSNSQYQIKEHGILVVKDQSSHPPAVCFRFKGGNIEIAQRLKFAVENYKGKIEWEMRGRQRDGLPGFNWCIEPSRVYDIQENARQINLAPNQYMAKYEPNFGPIAYEDLIGLTAHIKSEFKDVLELKK